MVRLQETFCLSWKFYLDFHLQKTLPFVIPVKIFKTSKILIWVLLLFFIKVMQLTLSISNSKGLTETLRDICTSTYQSWESEENNKLNNHI